MKSEISPRGPAESAQEPSILCGLRCVPDSISAKPFGADDTRPLTADAPPPNPGVVDERPSGTVTFLFTDIEGSTRLWQDHPAEMATAMSLHDEVTQSIADRHCGHVFSKAGDGSGIAFASAYEASAAAIELQGELGSKVEVDGRPLGVRMGLNTGEAVERDGDYLGTAVNIAARVRDLAHGGEILLSAATRDLVYRALPDATIRKLVPRRLKGISHREPVYRLGEREVRWSAVASRVALGGATTALVVVGAWLGHLILVGNGPTTTIGSTSVPSEPTTGLMTIDVDTVLAGDHEGRIVIEAHDVVLDCDGHVVRDPEPVDRDGDPNHLDAGILIHQQDGVTVKNCVVVDHWTGIAAIQSYGSWVRDNRLEHSDAPRDFTVRTGIGLSECGNCTVNNNNVTDIYGDAIDLYRVFDSEVYDNVVSAPGIAIRVIDSEYNTIRTNSLAKRPGGTRTGGGIGIGLFGRNSNNEIHDNTTRGFLIGIELDGWASNNTVRNNRGIFNDHDIATCPTRAEANLIEPTPGDAVSNLEDVLTDQCP